MEILLILVVIVSVFSFLFYLIEDESPVPFIISLSILMLVGTIWFSTTSIETTEVEIHTATTENTEFLYYVAENVIIPIPNNVVRVEKIKPRKGSVDEIKYVVYYK